MNASARGALANVAVDRALRTAEIVGCEPGPTWEGLREEIRAGLERLAGWL